MNKQELLHPKKLLEKLQKKRLASKDDEDCLNSRFSIATFVLLGGKRLKKKIKKNYAQWSKGETQKSLFLE